MSTSGTRELKVCLVLPELERQGGQTYTGVALWRRFLGPSGPVQLIAFGMNGTDARKLLSPEQIAGIEALIEEEERTRRLAGR